VCGAEPAATAFHTFAFSLLNARRLWFAGLGATASYIRIEHNGTMHDDRTSIEFAPFTALGVAISLFLGEQFVSISAVNFLSFYTTFGANDSWNTAICIWTHSFRFQARSTMHAPAFVQPSLTQCACMRVRAYLDILGFRNNAAYDRWWEGRRQWGAQLIAVRNFARLLTSLKVPTDDRIALIRLAVAHSHALRAQLRAAWMVGRGHGCCGTPGPPMVCCGAGAGAGAGVDEEHLDEAVLDRDSQLTPALVAALDGSLNPADKILGFAAHRVGTLHEAKLLDSYSVVSSVSLVGACCWQLCGGSEAAGCI
jgi:hypothetical protein